MDDRPTGAHRADIMHLAQRLGEHLRECEPVRQYQEAVQRVEEQPTLFALLSAATVARRFLQEINRDLRALLDVDFAELACGEREHDRA